MEKAKLTESQRQALMILAARHPDPVFPATANGRTCIASRSARRLEEVGLISASYRARDRERRWPMWNLTEKGLEYVALMVQAG